MALPLDVGRVLMRAGTGEVECLAKDDEGDLWVTRLKWGVGPPGGEPRMKGWDVLTIVGGKVKACYTFLDS